MAGRRLSGRSGPAAAIAAVVLLAAGCGSDQGDDVPPPEPTRPVADLGPAGDVTPLVGKYRYDADTTEDQVAAGAWRLLLGAERFLLVSPGGATQIGTYSVSKSTATFFNAGCGDRGGRYTWKRRDGALVFEELGDRCPNRAAVLTALPWNERAPGAPDDRSTRRDAAADTLTSGRFAFVAGPEDTALAAGRWALEARGGRYLLTQPDGTVHEGALEVSGGEARFRGAPCGTETGRYRWELSAGLLTFTVIDDSCANRVAILTARPWDGGAA